VKNDFYLAGERIFLPSQITNSGGFLWVLAGSPASLPFFWLLKRKVEVFSQLLTKK